MSKPYWELTSVEKLRDIAFKADCRTKTAIFEWINNYVEVFSNEFVIDKKHPEFSNNDYQEHAKRHKLLQLGEAVATQVHVEETIKDKSVPFERKRYTAYAILPKKKVK